MNVMILCCVVMTLFTHFLAFFLEIFAFLCLRCETRCTGDELDTGTTLSASVEVYVNILTHCEGISKQSNIVNQNCAVQTVNNCEEKLT